MAVGMQSTVRWKQGLLVPVGSMGGRQVNLMVGAQRNNESVRQCG